jgi:hypothetical protein
LGRSKTKKAGFTAPAFHKSPYIIRLFYGHNHFDKFTACFDSFEQTVTFRFSFTASSPTVYLLPFLNYDDSHASKGVRIAVHRYS